MLLSHLPITLPFSDGPRKIFVASGTALNPIFVQLCKDVLRQTRNAQGWPMTYGRSQPLLRLVRGPRAETTSYALDNVDPVKMAPRSAEVTLGETSLSMGVFPGLRARGMTDEHLMVLLMVHEAYHSNEMQRLQRTKVSWNAFRSEHLFQQAAQPEFEEPALRAMNRLSLLVPEKSIDEWRLKRLHSKILEGAADVHSLIGLRKMASQATTLRAGQALAVERHTAWKKSRATGAQAYDNADCIHRLLDTPWAQWPIDQNECSTFSWRHAMPYLRRARVLHDHQDIVDTIDKGLPKNRPWITIDIHVKRRNERVSQENQPPALRSGIRP